MVQWLRALVALPQDLSSNPLHPPTHSHLKFQSQRNFLDSEGNIGAQKYIQANTYAHKSKY